MAGDRPGGRGDGRADAGGLTAGRRASAGLHWHVHALDLRGHGLSARVPSQYRLVDYADDVMQFIEARFDAGPVVYGASLGGMIGILVAARHPERVRALIVGDSLLYGEAIADFPVRAPRGPAAAGGCCHSRVDPAVLDLIGHLDEEYDCSALLHGSAAQSCCCRRR